MNTFNLSVRILFFLLIISTAFSCKGQAAAQSETRSDTRQPSKQVGEQIGDYLIGLFEDSQGNLWFSTLAKGVAKYDGRTLRYYTEADGLPSNRVGSIVEDSTGILWFGTGAGIARYDGEQFTNLTESDGLCDDRVTSLLIDSNGDLWIGTWDGVCKLIGTTFEQVDVPAPDIPLNPNHSTLHWVTGLIEDSTGNIWISRDGYGICRYDGTSYTHLTTKDGLPSDCATEIIEDTKGSMWIGTRVAEKDNPDPKKRYGAGGLTKYDGKTMTHFPDVDGLHDSEVHEIYLDPSDNIWISTLEYGAYRYDGEVFTNYSVIDPVTEKPKAVIAFLQDRKGVMWIGCVGGLYRLDDDRAVNVTTAGPW